MKRLTTLTAICAVFVMALSLTATPLQNPPQPAPGQQAPRGQAPGQQTPGQQAPATAEKTFQGQLSKVDATAKEITLKGADNKEMIFTYNDQTQMTGVDNAPQGLSGKTGSNLKVTYRENRGSNLATHIEVQK